MNRSRRRLLRSTIELTALGFCPVLPLKAQRFSFRDDPFTLGIASGYPEPEAVVLWTRLAPEPVAPDGGMPAAAVPVTWELAADDRFARIVRSGETLASPDWAHSVHVEVPGLQPSREYWYRFTAGGVQSPIGRTRTAPAFDADLDRLRVGVANCQHYESGHYAAYRALVDDDVDLILHLGDYIYENRGITRVRSHQSPEPYDLSDYRERYAIYKSDPLLQQAHASCPWLVTWDDHEVDNDYADWRSQDNDTAEQFLARRAAAYKAYYEHMPLPRRHVPMGPNQRLHARRRFGRLAEILVLDGRQYRSDQVCDETGRLISPCAEFHDRTRTMLGAEQEAWLDRALDDTRGTWNLLAQQTVFSHMDQMEGPEVGYWSDGWSGYPAARERLISQWRERGTSNPIVLSGDIHGFLANDVHTRPGDVESPVIATELVTTSLSSRGPPQSSFDTWLAENDNVHLARSDVRGYTRLTLERDSLRAELVVVDDVTRADSPTHVLAAYDVENGRPGIVS